MAEWQDGIMEDWQDGRMAEWQNGMALLGHRTKDLEARLIPKRLPSEGSIYISCSSMQLS